MLGSLLFNLYAFPVSLIAKATLQCMGWKLLTPDDFSRLLSRERLVLVFSHTSYADFYILALYLMSYPHHLSYVKTLVKPQPFKYAGWLLRSMGAIPSTRLEDTQGGAVERIVGELKQIDRSILLVSPKGTIVNREWRSGYFHIARSLNAAIRVTGLDYEKKCVIVKDEHAITENVAEDTIKPQLYQDLSDIVPLVPEGEVVEIRQHNVYKRSIVDWTRFFGVTYGVVAGMSGLYAAIR